MISLHPILQLELRRWRWRRLFGQWLGLYALSLALAAGLQGVWAGDSFYNGTGPRLAERWFFSFAVTQAPLLAIWAAWAGAAAWRRMAHSGLLLHALVSPLRPSAILAGLGAGALWPVCLWVTASALGWGATALWIGAPEPAAVLYAHALLLAQALAFGLLGPALVAEPVDDHRRPTRRLNRMYRMIRIRKEGKGPDDLPPIPYPLSPIPYPNHPVHPVKSSGRWSVVVAALGLAAALSALFAVGPLLERCARPEWLISAVLVINPAVAMGTALDLDVLRTPWIYAWTAIPEYRFAYPAPGWTLALYAACALMGLRAAARRLGEA